jgi:uncharacterized repeat protein (TIGR03803 family)
MYTLNFSGRFQARVAFVFAALALLPGALGAPVAGQVWRLIEDFQGLPANIQSAPIDGFKDWEEVGSSIDFRVRRGYMDDTPTGNQNFALVGEGTAIGPASFPEHGKAGFFIDVPVGNSGSMPFVIVAPATGSADDYKSGPSFGVIDGGFFGSGTFFITPAGGGDTVISTNGGSLVVMRLVIDPFAFSGHGAGYFFYAPLSPGQYRGDLAFYPVPDLQGIYLGLRRPGVPAASSWDKILVTLGEFNAVDNIATGRVPVARLVALEVNQSIQDMDRSVQLVARKPTQARAYLEAGEPEDVGETVGGRLRGFADGLEGLVETEESPEHPLREFFLNSPATLTANVTQERYENKWSSTLNFVLPPPWTEEAVTLRFETDDITLFFGEKGGVPSSEVRVTFPDAPIPKLAIARIRVRPDRNSPYRPPPTMDSVNRVVERAINMYPVEDFDVKPVPEILVQAPVPVRDVSRLMDAIIRRRQDGALEFDRFLVGLVAEADLPRDGRIISGEASKERPAAWATVGQASSFAHELGHLFKRPHSVNAARFGTTNDLGTIVVFGACGTRTTNQLEEFPYFEVPGLGFMPTLGPMDAGFRKMVYGLDSTPQLSVPIWPRESFEVMSYCREPLERWVSDYTYARLKGYIRSLYGDPLEGFREQTIAATPTMATNYLLIRGILNLETGSAIWLPFHRLSLRGLPETSPPGQYSVRLLDAANAVLGEAAASVEVPEEGDEVEAPFSVMVPSNAAARKVQLLRNGVVVNDLTASANPPSVQLLTPLPASSSAGAQIDVTWAGADADGDPIHYSVEYSTDDGQTWNLVALDLPGDLAIALDREAVGGSPLARLRVLASDGFHCAIDEMDAPFTVANTAPLSSIRSPRDGANFELFQTVVFRGGATDMEDGRISGDTLEWRSDRDGLLGTGGNFSRKAWQLSEGTHLITLTARDAAGVSSVATNRIHVTRLEKPSLRIVRGTNGLPTLKVTGTIPSRSTIEVSSNLVDWVVWRELVHSNLTVEAIDNFGERGRFYRVGAGPVPTVINAQPFDRGGFVNFDSPVSIDVTGQWLSFQWFFNGAAIQGATNSTYVIQGSQTTNNGPYFVVVSNMTGVITSAVAQVTIVSNNWSTLHRFGSGGLDGTNGWGPLAYGGDGMLYGCARNGGMSNGGAIYRIGLNGSNYSVLRLFQMAADGAVPLGGVIAGSDGRLYGTCSIGGTNNSGTVWRINRDGSGFQVLRHFLSFGDCRNPNSELLEGSDGMLYGTAVNGGGFGNGGVFRLQKDGSEYGTIKGFRTTGGDGKGPIGGLIEGPDGHLYGTTESGGLTTNGIVFRLSKDGTNYTILKHMGLVETGTKNPRATLLLASDGFLYGTTVNGGPSGFGTVFKLRPNGEDFNVIYNFGDGVSDPQGPTTKLLEAPTGLLFGTSRIGGAGQGTIYRMRKDGSIAGTLKSLGGVDGARSQSALLMVGGFLYSSTFGGGVNEAGTIFRYWHWNLADKIME